MVARDSHRLSASTVLSHLGVMLVVAVLMGVVAAGLAIPFAGALGMGARDVARSMNDLPAELETRDLAQKTQIVDSSGNTIATLYDENRITVPLSQISRKMVEAIVAIEDYRFYQHGALDLRGTLRAFVNNEVGGGSVQGGSSITQQLVKMTLVDQADTRRERIAATDDTYERKLRELRYAIAMEKEHSKDWILERYLNIAYFGDGAYGIQAAAKHYFDVNAKNLNYKQSAMLAGLVKNPTRYDPTNAGPDATIARRNVVLQRMADLNVITDRKARRLKAQKLGVDLVRISNGCVNSRAPFFCSYVVEYLLDDPALGETEAARKELLYSGGLTIRTTIDLRYQDAAGAAVREAVNPTDRAIGALAMIEPRTGAVKAIAQSRPMGTRKKQGETFLNYVVPRKYGKANGFQAGSTFKAFVLAAAVKQGIPLNARIPAPQTVSLPNNTFRDCDGMLNSTDTWTPSNSTGAGTFNLYTGTQQSVNTFFARLEQRTGLCEPWKLAKKMGITLTDPQNNRVPPFVLGVTDSNPLEMAEAYATFAGRGLHCDARPVVAIEDSSGGELKRYDASCEQVLPSAVADAVNDVLRGVQEPGGFGYDNGLGLNVPSAAKTGTIQRNMAVWYVGYTPQLATAAMIAGADPNGNWVSLNGQVVGGGYVGEAFGSTVAGPMWADAMQVIQQWLEGDDFVTPSAQDIRGVLTTVPDVSGLSVDAARDRLESAGFNAVLGYSVNSEYAEGTVVYTSPDGGAQFGAGDTVTMYPSTGYVPPPPEPEPQPRPKRPSGGGGGGDNDGPGNGRGPGGGGGRGRG